MPLGLKKLFWTCHRITNTWYMKTPPKGCWDPTVGWRRKIKKLSHTPQTHLSHRTAAQTQKHLHVQVPFCFSLSFARVSPAGELPHSQSDEETNEMVMQELSGTGSCLPGLHVLPSQEQRMPSNSPAASLTYLSHTTPQPGGTRSPQAPCRVPPHLCRLSQGWQAPPWSAARCYWGTRSETSAEDKGKAQGYYFPTERHAAPWSHTISTTVGTIF